MTLLCHTGACRRGGSVQVDSSSARQMSRAMSCDEHRERDGRGAHWPPAKQGHRRRKEREEEGERRWTEKDERGASGAETQSRIA